VKLFTDASASRRRCASAKLAAQVVEAGADIAAQESRRLQKFLIFSLETRHFSQD
jgi:hypothetical protein